MSATYHAALKDKYFNPVIDYIQRAIIKDILEELSSRLGIDGAASVLAEGLTTAEALVDWLHKTHRDLPHGISVPAVGDEENVNLSPRGSTIVRVERDISDDCYTHVVDFLGPLEAKTISAALEKAFYALKAKGILVLCCLRNPRDKILDDFAEALGMNASKATPEAMAVSELSESQLMAIAEKAQFERGKVRWTRKELVIVGTELDQFVDGLKEVPLTRCNQRESDPGLHDELKHATASGSRSKSQFVVEYWLMVAMKWDLLCA